MRSLALIALGIALMPFAFGQGSQVKVRRQPVQIRVRHADPWAIKALLEGQSITAPELSTVLALMGMPAGATQGSGKPLFDDGKFIINPADNSLWFIPDN